MISSCDLIFLVFHFVEFYACRVQRLGINMWLLALFSALLWLVNFVATEMSWDGGILLAAYICRNACFILLSVDKTP